MTDELDWRKWLLDAVESDPFTEIKAPLAEMNLELLQLVAGSARSRPELSGPKSITELRPMWLEASNRMLERLAHVPIALLDIRLQTRNPGDRADSQAHGAAELDCFRGDLGARAAVQLAHSALTLAWSLTRSSRELARVVFGLNTLTASTVAQLGIQGIQHLAESVSHSLRLRWADRPDIWRELLHLAHQEQHDSTSLVDMRVLQYHLAELLQEAPKPAATGASAENGAKRK